MNFLFHELNNKISENLVYSIILFIGPNEENILFSDHSRRKLNVRKIDNKSNLNTSAIFINGINNEMHLDSPIQRKKPLTDRKVEMRAQKKSRGMVIPILTHLYSAGNKSKLNRKNI